MPEKLTESEVQKGQDPSSVKQWDNDVPLEKKFEDFAAIVRILMGKSLPLSQTWLTLLPFCR